MKNQIKCAKAISQNNFTKETTHLGMPRANPFQKNVRLFTDERQRTSMGIWIAITPTPSTIIHWDLSSIVVPDRLSTYATMPTAIPQADRPARNLRMTVAITGVSHL